jgi:hypothetical protein
MGIIYCWLVLDADKSPVLESIGMTEADAWMHLCDARGDHPVGWMRQGYHAIPVTLKEVE